MPSRVLTLSLVLLVGGAAGAAAHAPGDEGWAMPEGGFVLDGGDAEKDAAAAPSLAASARAYADAVPDPQAAPRPRPMAFEYSDGYRTRLKIHKYASFATLPLFVAQYAVGQKLYNGTGSDSTRSLHGALAASTAVLFGVNTVTGVWNLSEGRKDPNHRTKRMIHGLLMAVADAGFVATGLMTPDHEGEGEFGYQSGGTSQSTHRAVALTSMGIATVGYLMMLFH
jgi:hypothetical protein